MINRAGTIATLKLMTMEELKAAMKRNWDRLVDPECPSPEDCYKYDDLLRKEFRRRAREAVKNNGRW